MHLAGQAIKKQIKRLGSLREDGVNVHGMFTRSCDVHVIFT